MSKFTSNKKKQKKKKIETFKNLYCNHGLEIRVVNRILQL